MEPVDVLAIDRLLYITVTTDGVFDHMKINMPWVNTPYVFDFEDGIYSTTTATWRLKNERDIELFPEGSNPDIVRNTAGYNNTDNVISVDFYSADGTIIKTYYIKIRFVPYSLWKNDVIVGRQ